MADPLTERMWDIESLEHYVSKFEKWTGRHNGISLLARKGSLFVDGLIVNVLFSTHYENEGYIFGRDRIIWFACSLTQFQQSEKVKN